MPLKLIPDFTPLTLCFMTKSKAWLISPPPYVPWLHKEHKDIISQMKSTYNWWASRLPGSQTLGSVPSRRTLLHCSKTSLFHHLHGLTEPYWSFSLLVYSFVVSVRAFPHINSSTFCCCWSLSNFWSSLENVGDENQKIQIKNKKKQWLL